MDSFQKFSDQQLPQKRNFIVFLQMRAGLSWDAMLKIKNGAYDWCGYVQICWKGDER